ncbi:Hypothetical predicted protein [Marmota monax]|uniref:Ciliogenesis-associated TTC17-interacting protein n=1 Tax=Marmota monax TaxID=9995 RepID=A0A5E4AXM9_MARMO|nr:hypothetical protein GHT09_018616 [Marmota monax]VTJ61590.1 Hypothetical predicted protein [Marmota monax]
MLFFSETLAMVSDTGEPRGELTIEVQRGKYRDEMSIMSQCILVHAFSHGLLDKTVCGNSLLGRVPAADAISPRLWRPWNNIVESSSRYFLGSCVMPLTDNERTENLREGGISLTLSPPPAPPHAHLKTHPSRMLRSAVVAAEDVLLMHKLNPAPLGSPLAYSPASPGGSWGLAFPRA